MRTHISVEHPQDECAPVVPHERGLKPHSSALKPVLTEQIDSFYFTAATSGRNPG